MQELSGLHILLTYACNYSCQHCFVWGDPSQHGTWNWAELQHVVHQAGDIPSIKRIYFEGGEPFLYYPVLAAGIKLAKKLGFWVGLVTNAYWATSRQDALLWLRPLAGSLDGLSISSDSYHQGENLGKGVEAARQAALDVGIDPGVISIAQPCEADTSAALGVLPDGLSEVRYRGRAARELVDQCTNKQPWTTFNTCPYENLREPSRVHVDPLGYIHICQGITAGNCLERPLADLCANYQPTIHPILDPLLRGGPAELFRTYGLPVDGEFADACHLCDSARRQLRDRFPEALAPDQMYGIPD